MKVISGILKGRNIEGFNLEGTRPTMDRVKESLFGTIQNYVPDSIVLDLFAGSGNLGIEAISNGSEKVYFNDKSKEAYKVINSNVEKFNIKDKSVVMNYDYKICLEFLKHNNISFDIIFLDPPYKMEVINEIVDFIMKNKLLNDNGIIICEVGNNYINNFSELNAIKQKKYGDKEIIILKKEL